MAIDLQELDTRRRVVAANIRARMGWLDMSRPELAERTGIPQRTLFDRLEGSRPFKDDQLWRIAATLGLDTPAPLYEIPPGFPPAVRTEDEELVRSTYRQHRRSERLFGVMRPFANPPVGGLCLSAG